MQRLIRLIAPYDSVVSSNLIGIPLGVALGLVVIGFLVGITKTAIGGLGLLCAAFIAQLLPTRESTGVLLVLFLIGDLFAIRAYKAHVEFRFLKTLTVPVLMGVIVGAFYLKGASDYELKQTIGWIVLVLVAIYPLGNKLKGKRQIDGVASSKYLRNGVGSMAGFMSMVANAGGTPMSIYLLLRQKSLRNFMGNSAWFFFVVNLVKVPFTLALGLLNMGSFNYILAATPSIFIGAFVGRRIIDVINQALFVNVTLVTSAAVGATLIFG